MDAETLLRLRADLDRLQRDADRADGAVEQLLLQLRREHDCKSLADLDAALERLQELIGTKEQQADELEAEFRLEYKGKL